MSANEISFQAFADEVVEQVFELAKMVDAEVELFFCLQQVDGPDSNESIAYLLRYGENDAFLATDSRGRMWFCDCTRQLARQIDSTTDFDSLSTDLLDSLGCPVVGLKSASA